MIEFIIGLSFGIVIGMIILALGFIENSKTKDYIMIDGKMKWVSRAERLKEDLRKMEVLKK